MGSIPNLSIVRGPSRTLKPNLLHKIFHDVALGEAAQNTALIYEEAGNARKTSYSELEQITNRLSRAIRRTVTEKQLSPNSDGDYVVAVSMYPTDKLVITLLAIWKAGAAYLPLDPSFPPARIEHILKEAKPFMVICDEESKHFGSTYAATYETLYANSQSLEPIPLEDQEYLRHQRGDDLAIVLYTSGSSGIPKGVRLPHPVILNRLQWQFNEFPYSDTEHTGIFKTALTFVDSVSEIWGPLLNGRSILVVPKKITVDPEKLVATLEKYKIERLVLVPSLLRSLLLYLDLQNQKNLLSNLKTWVCSGEPLAVSLSEDFFRYFTHGNHILCNFYGSTEIMGDVTYFVMSNKEQLKTMEKVPIGHPVDNTLIYLLNEDMRPVQSGEIGELFVSGLNLAAGYVNGRDPDKFIENPLTIDPNFTRLFRTGDFAKIEKGELIYEGRIDSQVKVRGHRVDLAEVEKALNSIDGVDKGVVLCYRPGEVDQALISFATTNALMSEMQIETMLKNKLATYMVPQVIILESIPLLVNGKTDRQALFKYYENTNNNDDTSVQVDIDYTGISEGQMEAAKVLFETVASVLNRSARGAICKEANFYEIGGNSLNSIFTITSLKEKGYFIGISDFITASNFGEILQNMSPGKDNIIGGLNNLDTKYTAEMLKDEHKEAAIDMITTSFLEKADLEQWLLPDIVKEDYSDLIEKMWEPLVEKQLSYIARTESGKFAGVCFNFDARDEPEVEVHSKLTIIFEFLDKVEGPIKDNDLPPGLNKVLHCFMAGTNSSLSAKENVSVMQFMEEEVLRIARNRQFAGILTTNTSPLTQQLGRDIYGYQSLLDYQVNQYVASDGTKPFGKAPDEQRAIVAWKPI